MTYKFFWSGNDFESNFYFVDYYCSETGHFLCCSEQDYMWRKAMYFGDEDMAEKILMLRDPAQIKKAGKLVKNFDDEKWKPVKVQIMRDVCFRKFAASKELRMKLLDTGNDFLVEASPYDRVWGIGYSKYDALKVPISNWGFNLLGQVLMDVRSDFGGR